MRIFRVKIVKSHSIIISIFFADLGKGFHDIYGFIRRKIASTEGIPCDHLPDSSVARQPCRRGRQAPVRGAEGEEY